MIITIDGYSVTGKSTLADLLSKKLGFKYISSGLLYRAISYNLLINGIDISNFQDNLNKIYLISSQFQINLEDLKNNEVNLKSTVVCELGAQIAKLSNIRELVNNFLKIAATNSNIIIDGRDIGTVIFPNADLKFFFIADPIIRAQRLGKERNSKNIEALRLEIDSRDREDELRSISPLIKADNAFVIDTSKRTVLEILKILEQFVNEIKK